MRDFSQVKSLRELMSDEWIVFRQTDPTRFAQLEAELNGGTVQKTDTPRVLERSRNGIVQPRDSMKERRYINGILQP